MFGMGLVEHLAQLGFGRGLWSGWFGDRAVAAGDQLAKPHHTLVRGKTAHRGEQHFLFQLADSLLNLAGQRRLLVGAALITILFNVVWAISSYCGFLAFDLTISLLLVVILVPVVYSVTALPISINGLGVSEGVFVLVFTAIGLQPAEAAAVAILLRVTGMLLSGFGGLLYLFERRQMGRATVR